MSKIVIKDSKVELDANSSDSLKTILEKNNYKIKSSCSGHGTCGDCVIKVSKGQDNCTPVTYAEIKLLGNVFHMTHERLSCQVKLRGDVEIDLAVQNQKAIESVKSKSSKKILKSNLRKKNNSEIKIEVDEDNRSLELEKRKPKEGGMYRPKRKKYN